MGSKKKLLTTVAALTTAAALLLGGTFAWQSISQSALNESADTINPGGRLHNDIAAVEGDPNSTYNFIYVENFSGEKQDDGTVTGGEDIYARIRLEEYMELVMNYGDADIEVVKNVAGVKTLLNADAKDENGNQLTNNSATRQDKFKYTYELHLFGEAGENEEPLNATDKYWTWTTGTADYAGDYGYYMPTYNKNKDSLAADQNGSYTVTLGGITDRDKNYADFVDYSKEENKTKSAYAIYDNDGNDTDELAVAGLSATDLNDIIENGKTSAKWTENADAFDKAVRLVENESHTAKEIPATKGLISMDDWVTTVLDIVIGYPENWQEQLESEGLNRCWVYDTDGWVYWSSPIHPGEATGPLLEGFSLRDEMDDTWYYAINVVAQFITADDLGKTDNTGFYDENGWYDPTDLGEDKATKFVDKGKAPSEKALHLLTIIGVNTEGHNPQTYDLTLNYSDEAPFVIASVGDTVNLKDFSGAAITSLGDVQLMGAPGNDKLTVGKDYRFDSTTGAMTLLNADTLQPGVLIEVANGVERGYIALDPGDADILRLQSSDSGAAREVVAPALGKTVEVKYGDDEKPSADYIDVCLYKIGSSQSIPSAAFDYNSITGQLKITDETYVGKMLEVLYRDIKPEGEVYYSGYVLPQPAADDTTGDSDSTGSESTYDYEVTVSEGATAVLSVKAGEAVKLKNADGTSPALTSAEFKKYSWTSAAENTDFTYEDGVLTLKGDQLQPGIGVFLYTSVTDMSPRVAVIYEDDGKITFNSTYYDCTQAAVNEGVTVETGEGTAPDSVTAENTSYVAGTHYKYDSDTGTLTVLSNDLKGKMLTIMYGDQKAMIFVKND